MKLWNKTSPIKRNAVIFNFIGFVYEVMEQNKSCKKEFPSKKKSPIKKKCKKMN